jgi:hypothetical protein
MPDRTPEEIQAEIDAAKSAEKALEAELLGAVQPNDGWIPPKKVNWHPNGGQEVALMVRAAQAGLVRTPGEPITKDEVVAFLASKGLS